MKIQTILTKREFEHWPSYDLVYEWEDILSKEMNCPLKYEQKLLYKKYFKRIPILPSLLLTDKTSFQFEMSPLTKHRIGNKENIVPCIIDYYLHDKQLSDFTKCYCKNKIVFVSSKEVYDHLLEQNVDKFLNLAHLPLSISDKYTIQHETQSEKKYDLVLMGRQNPILQEFLNIYISKHKDLNYVYREQRGNKFLYYTSRGEFLGDINSREKYISLMSQAKCGLYATPGVDGGDKRTNGFNQVTPRFLELVACGCHVIARYKANSDTDYYRVNDFSECIDDYDSFEKCLDNARNNEVDMDFYSKYLSNHYTSKRADSIKSAIRDI